MAGRVTKVGIRQLKLPTYYPTDSNSNTFAADVSALLSEGEALILTGKSFSVSASALSVSLYTEVDSGELVQLSGSALSTSLSATILPLNSLSMSVSAHEANATASIYTGTYLVAGISAFSSRLSAIASVVNTVSLSQSALVVDLDATASTLTTVAAGADTDYPYISGNTYIVVNLRTKTHTTYRDGSNAAMAKTGELTFDSHRDKNISDVYLLARATEDVELLVKNNEITERNYPATFANLAQPNLKNKKIVLAKGLKGQNWQLSIVALDDYAEVREIELNVNELARRI